MRIELWDRQGKHCESLEGNVKQKVVLMSTKTRFWGEIDAFSTLVYPIPVHFIYDDTTVEIGLVTPCHVGKPSLWSWMKCTRTSAIVLSFHWGLEPLPLNSALDL